MTNVAKTTDGYIIQDAGGYAIFGTGSTIEKAWAEVVDGVGYFFDKDGEPIDAETAFHHQFKAYPATAALIAQVADHGGAIAWDIVDGIATTINVE
jgi:hypothetical protein